MSSLETRLPQQFEYHPGLEKPPTNKRKVKKVEHADPATTERIRKTDEANLAAATKTAAWLEKKTANLGSLPIDELLQARAAQKIFKHADPIIDEALGLPPDPTIPGKHSLKEHTLSDFERSIAGQTHMNPKTAKDRVRKALTNFFKRQEEDSSAEEQIH